MGVTFESDVVDRAADLVEWASVEVAGLWRAVCAAVRADPPEVGLSAGERPAADVEVLASAAARCEYLLAVRLHAAAAGGALPLEGQGMLTARGWSVGTAKRLVRAGGLADRHAGVARAWSAGVITSEHVDSVARAADRFTGEELAALIGELGPLWGALSPAGVARFVAAADRMAHPPPDPGPGEVEAYEARHLSFGILGDTVVLTGALPRVEGELVIAAIDAFAERLRCSAEQVPAAARRADALVELVSTAHAAGSLPTRGGLPVSLSVTVEHTSVGDPVCTTSRGHQLTAAETRWAACDAAITPIAVHRPDCPDHTGTATRPGSGGVGVGVAWPSAPIGDGSAVGGCRPGSSRGCDGGAGPDGSGGGPPSPTARIAALAAVMLGAREVLAVGRTQRTATAAQRRALAIRDQGCVIPGCGVAAEACQVHHLTEWADGGRTDLANLVLVWRVSDGLCNGDPVDHLKEIDCDRDQGHGDRPGAGGSQAAPGVVRRRDARSSDGGQRRARCRADR